MELAIDGNPVVSANLDSYRQTLVNRIRSLKHLVRHNVCRLCMYVARS